MAAACLCAGGSSRLHLFNRVDLGLLCLAFHRKVVARLHVHPKPRRRAKELGQAECRVRRYRRGFAHQALNARAGNMQLLGQRVWFSVQEGPDIPHEGFRLGELARRCWQPSSFPFWLRAHAMTSIDVQLVSNRDCGSRRSIASFKLLCTRSDPIELPFPPSNRAVTGDLLHLRPIAFGRGAA